MLPPSPARARRKVFLQALASADRLSILKARIERRGREGISLSQLITETAWTKQSIEAALVTEIKQSRILRIVDLFVYAPAVSALQELIVLQLPPSRKRTHWPEESRKRNCASK